MRGNRAVCSQLSDQSNLTVACNSRLLSVYSQRLCLRTLNLSSRCFTPNCMDQWIYRNHRPREQRSIYIVHEASWLMSTIMLSSVVEQLITDQKQKVWERSRICWYGILYSYAEFRTSYLKLCIKWRNATHRLWRPETMSSRVEAVIADSNGVYTVGIRIVSFCMGAQRDACIIIIHIYGGSTPSQHTHMPPESFIRRIGKLQQHREWGTY